jgi:hypothetical protein
MEITLCCEGLGDGLTQQISDGTWLTHKLSQPVKSMEAAERIQFTYYP